MRRGGFTLIEMLVVLVLLAMAAAIAAPAIRSVLRAARSGTSRSHPRTSRQPYRVSVGDAAVLYLASPPETIGRFLHPQSITLY